VTLPQGWAETTLNEALEQLRTGPFGSAVHKHDYIVGGVPLINPMHINGGAIQPSETVTVSAAKADALGDFRLQAGEVIIGRRGEMGRCAVINQEQVNWLIGTGSMALKPSPALDSEFLQRFLASDEIVAALEGDAVGSTMVNLNQSILLGLPVSLPPLAEQRRIVAKLDALTARLARARAELDRVPVLSAKLRQSALTKAFEALQEAPTAGLKGLTSKIGSGSTPRGGKAVYVDDGVPFIRSQNVYFEGFDYDGLVHITDGAAKALSGVKVHEHDVLLNITGASIGRACIVPVELIGARVSQHVAIIRPLQKLLPEFLLAFLRTPAIQDWVWNANYGVTRQALTKGMIEDIQVPMPPVNEQREVVQRLEAAFARADRLEAEATRARALLDRLESALLAKAFRGELVPQDPNDEPAQTLLARIRTQRAAAPKAKRGRKALNLTESR
jgi:type I restriction enzyme S subunit